MGDWWKWPTKEEKLLFVFGGILLILGYIFYKQYNGDWWYWAGVGLGILFIVAGIFRETIKSAIGR